ncbi:winged helix-turn-helix domain-containing protein [Actinotalea sp. M2MS4P-6]|uniref:winged helix-turn-helix domain-containing protein n=1 Tax=Actinotalea sp. M2MS4P-6 TaxID=2983762 RepID=UPI0021E4A3E5|nr:winged helix-turn-helix domain-containing protein [Actinotalea sp. M2MS4P-6]MCV2393873.1 winged helix-turn-helix domain-containing protein [Actinotalea sp. M2MS4P-6]
MTVQHQRAQRPSLHRPARTHVREPDGGGRPLSYLGASLAAIPDVDEVVVAQAARQVTVNGAVLALPPKEFDLLVHLLAARGRVVSRDELHRTVWAGRHLAAASRTIDAHIRRLRRAHALAELVATVHGTGYRIVPRPNVRLVP